VALPEPATPRAGMDYGDNLFRMALFAWAALEAPLVVPCGGVPFGEDVVFLANDWQAGFVPLVLTSHYRRYKVYSKARCSERPYPAPTPCSVWETTQLRYGGVVMPAWVLVGSLRYPQHGVPGPVPEPAVLGGTALLVL
jgi:hypothetical protein